MKQVNIGIVGTGFVQDTFHMPAYSEIKLANVVAVAGTTSEKVNAFNDRWKIGSVYHGIDAIDRICRDPNVEVIDVGIPNDRHLQAILAASENHKHVICEKPLARDSKEAEKALDAVSRYGVIHCYAENQVFMPQLTRAFQIIKDGAVGKITWIRAREAHSGPHSKWFWDPELAGGGALIDMGCHTIEIARYLLGKQIPIEVAAWTRTLIHKTKAEDNSLVLLNFEGSLGQCENSWSAKGGLDVRVEVYGSDGSAFIDVTRGTGIRIFTTAPEEKLGYIGEKADVRKGWMFPTWREHETYGYLHELEHFLECIAKGETPLETFKDGYIINQIMDAAYQASKEKRWVALPH